MKREEKRVIFSVHISLKYTSLYYEQDAEKGN